jgi:hypothetical protein
MHAGEPFGLPDPIAFDEVLQDRDRFLLGQAAMKQGSALAFREACLARLAVKEPDLLMFAVAVTDREVTGVTLPGERARRVLAAEAREVVHGYESSWPGARGAIIGHKSQITLSLVGLQ